MDKERLKLALEELKEKYEKEWRSVEDTILKHLGEVRETVELHFKNNKEIDFETAKEIYEKIQAVDNLTTPYLLWISPSPEGFGKGKIGDLENIRDKILNNQIIIEFLIEVKSLESLEELQRVKERIERLRKGKEVSGVGIANISTWMCIFNPRFFAPTFENTVNEHLRNDLGIDKFWGGHSDVDRFIEFTRTLKEVSDKLGIKNMLEAALYLSKYGNEKGRKHGRRIWLIAPGTGAEYWDVCVERRIICVGWREAAEDLKEALFDINNYKTFKTEMSRFGYKDSAQLWKFLKEMSKGDILLAKKGAKKIIGIGVVDSEPEIDLQLDYPIYRKVKWYRANLDIDSPKQFAGTITELTDEDLTKVPELKNIIDKMIEAGPKADKYLEEMGNKIETLLTSKKQLILYGPPGTGKTWLARNYIKAKTNDNREFYDFVTFHPSYSYEEFVEGLKPIPAGNGVNFVVEDGIFKRMAIKAMCEILKNKKDYPELSKISENLLKSLKEIEKGITATKNDVPGEYSKLKKELWANLISLDEKELKSLFKGSDQVREFYLVIDEINRGDISKIFGELITLLEADKRLGGENQIFVTLPYSKEPFAVPPNLHIIGTMNTADRSIALIDVALRRRFGFIEVMPSYRVLLKELLDKEVESEKQAIDEINAWEPENLDENDPQDIKRLAIRVLYSINERIRKLYDRDHQIGHSYLLKLKEGKDADSTIRTLRFIWYHEILPLLQEYFYDSPEKLREIIKDFVEVSNNYFEFKDFEKASDFWKELRKVAENK